MIRYMKTIEENDGKHIDTIITSVTCPTHQADIGDACRYIISDNGILKSVCGKRARKAGANGEVSQEPIKKKVHKR